MGTTTSVAYSKVGKINTFLRFAATVRYMRPKVILSLTLVFLKT
jgi:hypothetical protein